MNVLFPNKGTITMTDKYMKHNISDIELDSHQRLREALDTKRVAKKRLYLALLSILIASIVVVLCIVIYGLSGEKDISPLLIASMLTNGLCFIIADRIWSLGKNKPGDSFRWSWLWLGLGLVNGIIIVIGPTLMLIVFIRGKILITANYEKAISAIDAHVSQEKLRLEDEETERIQLAKNEIIAIIDQAIGNDKIIQQSKVLAGPTAIENVGSMSTDPIVDNKPNARGSNNIPFTICPYCSKELNRGNPPNFCPYCGVKLIN
jgi:hypothetical protein